MGEVVLVGSGPGDPELLTIKALKLIQRADVIVYDSLVGKEVLSFARPDAQLCFVGKRKHRHSVKQAQICQLLVNYGLRNQLVVRLKGGEPLIFGRATEEIEALNRADIPWSIVPGITAGHAAAASQAIPLTVREKFYGVSHVTAHRSHGGLAVDWDVLLQEQQTIVVYMGLSLLEDIVAGLLQRGRRPDTPFTIVSNASSQDEQVVAGTLGLIVELARAAQPPAPAVLILGPAPFQRPFATQHGAEPQISQVFLT